MSSSNKHNVCIAARKIYDWVNRQVDLPLICLTGTQLENVFECANNGFSPPDDLCTFLEEHPNYFTECEIVSASCQEIIQPGGRQQVTVTLQSGDSITLEKVKILVNGSVRVFIRENDTLLCRSGEIPFTAVQTFFLCAPENTEVRCRITYSECDSDLTCTASIQQLNVSVLLCLDVQTEADVNLELEATICMPRKELPIDNIVCPVEFPEQCPDIFPGKYYNKNNKK